MAEEELVLFCKGRGGYRGMQKKARTKRREVKTPELYLGKCESDRLGNCAGVLSRFRDTTEQHHFSLAS